MKNPVLLLCLLGVLSFGTSAGQQRESPGKLEIAKHPLILEPPPPPPPQSQHKIDVDKLHEEANEIEKRRAGQRTLRNKKTPAHKGPVFELSRQERLEINFETKLHLPRSADRKHAGSGPDALDVKVGDIGICAVA